MQVWCRLLLNSLRPNYCLIFILYIIVYIISLLDDPLSLEYWGNGLLNCVPFKYLFFLGTDTL